MPSILFFPRPALQGQAMVGQRDQVRVIFEPRRYIYSVCLGRKGQLSKAVCGYAAGESSKRASVCEENIDVHEAKREADPSSI